MASTPPVAVGSRALVVDDDQQVRRVLQRQLRQLGFADVEAAADGADAMREIEANGTFDVVLCDLGMPNEDGLVFLRRLSASGARPAVILLSGESAPVLDAARRLGLSRNIDVVGVATKPHTLAILAQLVSNLRAYRPAAEPGKPAPLLDAAELAECIAQGAMEVWFQPQLDIASQQVRSAEALVRLRTQDNGLVLPGRFITTAEEHGLIAPLTTYVLEQAVEWSCCWSDAGAPLTISVNLSMSTLSDVRYPDAVAGLCARRGVSPSRIMFELTESALAEDSTVLLDIVTRLRLKGFRLSIDDFGSGYSSLDQLRALPFNELKLDQRFVRDAGHDERSRHILRHSLDLARQLGLTTVAEGVESQADLALVAGLGCDLAQGYLIAPPMPAGDVAGWLESRAFYAPGLGASGSGLVNAGRRADSQGRKGLRGAHTQ